MSEHRFSFSKDIITAGFEDECVAAGCKVPIKSGDKVWYNMAEEGWQHERCPTTITRPAACPVCLLYHAGECF